MTDNLWTRTGPAASPARNKSTFVMPWGNKCRFVSTAGALDHWPPGALPRDDSAVEIHRVDSSLYEVAGRLSGAAAGVADGKDLRVARQLIGAGRKLLQRDVDCVLEMPTRPFVVFAYVEHHKPVGERIGYAVDLHGRDRDLIHYSIVPTGRSRKGRAGGLSDRLRCDSAGTRRANPMQNNDPNAPAGGGGRPQQQWPNQGAPQQYGQQPGQPQYSQPQYAQQGAWSPPATDGSDNEDSSSKLGVIATIVALVAALAAIVYGAFAAIMRRDMFANDLDSASESELENSDKLDQYMMYGAIALVVIAVLLWLFATASARRGRSGLGFGGLGVLVVGAIAAGVGAYFTTNDDADKIANGYIIIGAGFVLMGVGLLLGAVALRQPGQTPDGDSDGDADAGQYEPTTPLTQTPNPYAQQPNPYARPQQPGQQPGQQQQPGQYGQRPPHQQPPQQGGQPPRPQPGGQPPQGPPPQGPPPQGPPPQGRPPQGPPPQGPPPQQGGQPGNPYGGQGS